jgi:1-acyl-sn-glycerol-3-phosphate acyltransferase
MRIKNWTWTYALGYLIVFIGIRTFYKRHKVIGKKNIPKNKPIIFASNHQNAFMDPVMIAVKLNQPTYYLVRADVFKKKLVAKIFDSINMLPIYRERDGVDTKDANVAVFNRCHDILSKNRPIIIFPEGNHGKLKNLRPLKKGFARIALGAMEKHGVELDVKIVPVGLNYSNLYNMGAELVINFGEPIDAAEWLKAGSGLDINTTTHMLHDKMSDLIIDIRKTEYYDFIHEMMLMFDEDIRTKYVKGSNDLEDKFKAQKQFIAKAEDWLENNGTHDLNDNMVRFSTAIKKKGLRYWLFSKEQHSTVLNWLLLVLLAPLALFGAINSYIPYILPVRFVKKKIKDLQFHSSMKMALSVVFFGIFWGIQTLLVALFTDNYYWVYYLIAVMMCSSIAYHYWILWLKTKGKMAYNNLKSNDPLKAQYGEFKKMKEEILC